jgi:hypothetical protein
MRRNTGEFVIGVPCKNCDHGKLIEPQKETRICDNSSKIIVYSLFLEPALCKNVDHKRLLERKRMMLA